ncbi:unnamed protein product [Rotaria socialis]|uniref:DYW domain-containing protein n=1 Tax=Rotaria socialis TaxID=392032 RepID=A0A818MLV2_9BILA|nr:unnamed protein product [Rotaria socialis]CAF3391845.1 unnamed protein product [Rotaria socialis]CAF3470152.1 unnamed protein product [Rotaria socialis]CAF3591120.1 unnamed protein product [Rotaria socialis]CAF3660503.1 unnamed protein product [Rotaria socialis]
MQYSANLLRVIANFRNLLSRAQNFDNSCLLPKTYDRIKKFFPEMTNSFISPAVLLANTDESSGNSGKKADGCSPNAANIQHSQSRVHDKSPSRSTEVYPQLDNISNEFIEDLEYYDSDSTMCPSYQSKAGKPAFFGHAELLAIAWNFVANPNTTRIQLTSNIRICSDCHRTIKMIAAIRKCEIIVRDSNRIHHFSTNGKCSCKDYF